MSEASELLGPGTWVQQGPATLIVRESGWVVLVPGTGKGTIEAAWTVLGTGPTAEEFLDRLVESAELESADALAAILFGITEGTSVSYGVKGKTPIAVYTAEGSHQVAGTDDEPFVLTTFEHVRRAAFGDLPAEASLGAPRLEAGITRVRGFVHMSVDPAELDDEARQALADQVENDGRSIEDPAAKARRAENPPTAAPTPAATTSTPPLRKPSIAGRGAGEMPPSISGGGSSASSSGAAAAPAADAGPSVFDGLFSDAGPAPDADPAPPPAPAPDVDPARVTTQEPAAGRRRLVSTSLFDRKRSASPAPAERPASERSVDPTGRNAPSEDGSSPSSPSAHSEPPTAPAASPPASVPTPNPPDEEEAPQITVADPHDHGEGPDEESPAQSTGPPAVPAPTGGPPAPAESEPDGAGSYDDLFGKTVFRRIEDAAVRRSAEDDEPPDDPQASTPAEDEANSQRPVSQAGEPAPQTDPGLSAEPEPSVRTAPVSSTDASASIGGDFIDWVPGVGRTAPEIAHTAARRAAEASSPTPASPQVHLAQHPPAQSQAETPPPSATASAQSQQPQPQPQPQHQQHGAAGGSPTTPPRVSAASAGHRPASGTGQPAGGVVALPGLVCVNGHANSPERSRCRSCHAPLLGETRTVARPPLGTVDISTGASFMLDRTAVIGRRPRASRVSAHDVPQLITVPSPQQDISRSHLELRLEGWHVVALDLGTTNGTTLYRPGMEPLRLRTREGVVLTDGDQFDLGDGITLLLREAA